MAHSSLTNPDLETWQLSEAAIAFFEDRPEMLEHIAKAKEQPPFAAEYTPSLVEVLFNDIVYIRYENDSITAIRESGEGFVPNFWEICFDGETALFVVGNEVVIDRAGEMADFDVLIGKFNGIPSLEVAHG